MPAVTRCENSWRMVTMVITRGKINDYVNSFVAAFLSRLNHPVDGRNTVSFSFVAKQEFIKTVITAFNAIYGAISTINNTMRKYSSVTRGTYAVDVQWF